MKKIEKSVLFKIKGKEWAAKFFPEKQYQSLHGEDSSAITIGVSREIHFIKSDFSVKFCLHELFHAFIFESATESSSLTRDQSEELCCSLIGEHLEEIGLLSRRITDFFLSQRKK